MNRHREMQRSSASVAMLEDVTLRCPKDVRGTCIETTESVAAESMAVFSVDRFSFEGVEGTGARTVRH